EQRNQLMTHVAQLYSMSNDRINPELLAVYDSVLVRLADLVEEEALAFVAEKLAPLTNAPQEMVRKLALEPINVARPVLEQSPVLTDTDLIKIAGEADNDHLEAIAGRNAVAPMVSAVLVDRGDGPVKLRLTRNGGARFYESSFSKLVQDASHDEQLQETLADRDDLPVAVVRALVEVATVNVRRKLLKHGRPEVAKRVTEAASLAAERLSNEQWLSRYDFDAAYRSVSLAAKKDPISEASVIAMARAGRFPEAVVMFALCAAVPLEDAKHWCVRSDPKPFLIMCRALDFSQQTVDAFLRVGPWLRRLDREAREQAEADYGTIDAQTAREIVSQWRVSQKSVAA
ncbi:MAG: DUF2336 domain-containing protein, partial [Pseudomonadota bacterium]